MRLSFALSVVLLSACASLPLPESKSSAKEEPEINLSMPPPQECTREVSKKREVSFLDKGLIALGEGKLPEALQYFQRYQRTESTPEGRWESSIALAYMRALPDSPSYNPARARTGFTVLNGLEWRSMDLHTGALLLREALEVTLQFESEIRQLEASKASLEEDLRKREETIKKLRELTLGQSVDSP